MVFATLHVQVIEAKRARNAFTVFGDAWYPSVVKTTVNLPATLLQKVEQAAAAHGKTAEQFIVQTLEKNLSSPPDTTAPQHVTLPIIPSKQPGTLRLNADIEELLA